MGTVTNLADWKQRKTREVKKYMEILFETYSESSGEKVGENVSVCRFSYDENGDVVIHNETKVKNDQPRNIFPR